jgi:hypothetical protein
MFRRTLFDLYVCLAFTCQRLNSHLKHALVRGAKMRRRKEKKTGVGMEYEIWEMKVLSTNTKCRFEQTRGNVSPKSGEEQNRTDKF